MTLAALRRERIARRGWRELVAARAKICLVFRDSNAVPHSDTKRSAGAPFWWGGLVGRRAARRGTCDVLQVALEQPRDILPSSCVATLRKREIRGASVGRQARCGKPQPVRCIATRPRKPRQSIEPLFARRRLTAGRVRKALKAAQWPSSTFKVRVRADSVTRRCPHPRSQSRLASSIHVRHPYAFHAPCGGNVVSTNRSAHRRRRCARRSLLRQPGSSLGWTRTHRCEFAAPPFARRRRQRRRPGHPYGPGCGKGSLWAAVERL